MKMAHLGYGVAHGLVVGPFGDVAPAEVGHGIFGRRAQPARCSQDLEAVAQDHDHVRAKPCQGVGETNHPQAHGLGDGAARIPG